MQAATSQLIGERVSEAGWDFLRILRTVALAFGSFKGEWRVGKTKRAHRGEAVGALFCNTRRCEI